MPVRMSHTLPSAQGATNIIARGGRSKDSCLVVGGGRIGYVGVTLREHRPHLRWREPADGAVQAARGLRARARSMARRTLQDRRPWLRVPGESYDPPADPSTILSSRCEAVAVRGPACICGAGENIIMVVDLPSIHIPDDGLLETAASLCWMCANKNFLAELPVAIRWLLR